MSLSVLKINKMLCIFDDYKWHDLIVVSARFSVIWCQIGANWPITWSMNSKLSLIIVFESFENSFHNTSEMRSLNHKTTIQRSLSTVYTVHRTQVNLISFMNFAQCWKLSLYPCNIDRNQKKNPSICASSQLNQSQKKIFVENGGEIGKCDWILKSILANFHRNMRLIYDKKRKSEIKWMRFDAIRANVNNHYMKCVWHWPQEAVCKFYPAI